MAFPAAEDRRRLSCAHSIGAAEPSRRLPGRGASELSSDIDEIGSEVEIATVARLDGVDANGVLAPPNSRVHAHLGDGFNVPMPHPPVRYAARSRPVFSLFESLGSRFGRDGETDNDAWRPLPFRRPSRSSSTPPSTTRAPPPPRPAAVDDRREPPPRPPPRRPPAPGGDRERRGAAARGADPYAERHPAASDWMRRDAAESMWRSRQRQWDDAETQVPEPATPEADDDWRMGEFAEMLQRENGLRRKVWRWWLGVWDQMGDDYLFDEDEDIHDFEFGALDRLWDARPPSQMGRQGRGPPPEYGRRSRRAAPGMYDDEEEWGSPPPRQWEAAAERRPRARAATRGRRTTTTTSRRRLWRRSRRRRRRSAARRTRRRRRPGATAARTTTRTTTAPSSTASAAPRRPRRRWRRRAGGTGSAAAAATAAAVTPSRSLAATWVARWRATAAARTRTRIAAATAAAARRRGARLASAAASARRLAGGVRVHASAAAPRLSGGAPRAARGEGRGPRRPPRPRAPAAPRAGARRRPPAARRPTAAHGGGGGASAAEVIEGRVAVAEETERRMASLADTSLRLRQQRRQLSGALETAADRLDEIDLALRALRGGEAPRPRRAARPARPPLALASRLRREADALKRGSGWGRDESGTSER